jgi:fructose-1,6-bisphosphatase/inositol monophosphatase family enzyme
MHHDTQEFSSRDWQARLTELAGHLRQAAREELSRSLGTGEVQRPVGQGVGDLTYALDEATENVLEAWFEQQACRAPLSLFSEDRGWRHLGPDGAGSCQTLPGFDHGGARLMVDPVDGTRNLMADIRSAWTVLSLCGPGQHQPSLSNVEVALLAELPDSRAARYRLMGAKRGAGAWFELRDLTTDALIKSQPLVADEDDRPDHGYFSIFRYTPAMRPRLAQVEADFFVRLAEHEQADLRNCFDDQYISNGGQLALLSLGTYRMIADLRGHFAKEFKLAVTTSKAYDCAGAILIAREAGCAVLAPLGKTLDFPLDGSTPVSFVGFANRSTAKRLAPHLWKSLG